MSSYSSLSRILSPFRVQTRFEENSLPNRYMAKITLFCYVLGTPVYSAIPVDIGNITKVDGLDVSLKKLNFGHIKKLIWPNNNKANELKLRKFLKEFPVGYEFLDDYIHIIVQPPLPATTAGSSRGITQVFENKDEALPDLEKPVPYNWLKKISKGHFPSKKPYELLCRAYGIYFSLNTENNLGSRDMDAAITDLSFNIVSSKSKSQENNNIALRYTRAMLLGRLFILTKLLEFHRHNNFMMKFASFVPEQEQLPIAIDESQSAIRKYEKMFPPSNPVDELRPFFVILLRTVLQLTTKKLCLILSGTGMSFDDIKNYTSSSIAKRNGPTFKDFFSIHDGFYEISVMSEYIKRFLPLDDESMESTFNIFRGRRRFVVQFLEESLLDNSSMSRDANKSVEVWQCNAKNFIILTFKGVGVIEMVQYGFAQLCDFKGLSSDHDIFQKDIIEMQIAETIPFLAFREYIEKDCRDRNELEKKLLQDLCSGNMKKFNLHDFLDDPSTAFFMPEKEATADNLKAKRVNKRVNNKEIDIERQRKKIKTAD
ncbi:unnamed protein product [Rhizophagus irregularis]|nr:unnamed protein product [Rhizophagus irregularis]CAB4432378.1 unnamed protein product [Rhizophagus irregularis]